MISENTDFGIKAKFVTNSKAAQWRCDTAFTKEPVTSKWLMGMRDYETLLDVGANMGVYSMIAGLKGLTVYAFEPESENYALLQRNIFINGLRNVKAYCVALSDKPLRLSNLYLSAIAEAGSCHSFGENVGTNLEKKEDRYAQGCIGMRIDDLGISPDYIKIDVDGIEHKVIEGAKKTLGSGVVRSLLIEVNSNLSEHIDMADYLLSIGYTYDKDQFEESKRKDGFFEGTGEILFTREGMDERVARKIDEAEICLDPFPHIYVEDIFPEEYYPHMQFPDDYKPLAESRATTSLYPDRETAIARTCPLGDYVATALIEKFERVLPPKTELWYERFFCRDSVGYSIGPHIDNIGKYLSALFYIPKAVVPESGTSLYSPLKHSFIGDRRKPYKLEEGLFERIKQVEFQPNTLFAFPNMDHAFHGLEKTTGQRDILMFDIHYKA